MDRDDYHHPQKNMMIAKIGRIFALYTTSCILCRKTLEGEHGEHEKVNKVDTNQELDIITNPMIYRFVWYDRVFYCIPDVYI